MAWKSVNKRRNKKTRDLRAAKETVKIPTPTYITEAHDLIVFLFDKRTEQFTVAFSETESYKLGDQILTQRQIALWARTSFQTLGYRTEEELIRIAEEAMQFARSWGTGIFCIKEKVARYLRQPDPKPDLFAGL